MTDPIGDYYDRVDKRSKEAWERYRKAMLGGLLPSETPAQFWERIRALREAAIDAGDCGD